MQKSATASQNLETAGSMSGRFPALSTEQAVVYPVSAVIAQSIKTNNRSPFEVVSNTTQPTKLVSFQDNDNAPTITAYHLSIIQVDPAQLFIQSQKYF